MIISARRSAIFVWTKLFSVLSADAIIMIRHTHDALREIEYKKQAPLHTQKCCRIKYTSGTFSPTQISILSSSNTVHTQNLSKVSKVSMLVWQFEHSPGVLPHLHQMELSCRGGTEVRCLIYHGASGK